LSKRRGTQEYDLKPGEQRKHDFHWKNLLCMTTEK
jgi:hypothetical protein